MGIAKISEISAFFLAYNEEGNIKKLIETADKVLKDISKKYEMIIVLYKGSTDKTEDIIKLLLKKYGNLRLIYQEIDNKGYGVALKLGLQAARYNTIFYSDADLQFDISEIEKLIPYAEKYGIITGYRKKRRDPLMRIITAKVYNKLVSLIFHFKVKDIDCAFKIFNKDIFDNIKIKSKTGMILPEIYAKANKLGYNIQEVAITHYPRYAGISIFESKFALVKFSVVKGLLKEMIRLKKDLDRNRL